MTISDFATDQRTREAVDKSGAAAELKREAEAEQTEDDKMNTLGLIQRMKNVRSRGALRCAACTAVAGGADDVLLCVQVFRSGASLKAPGGAQDNYVRVKTRKKAFQARGAASEPVTQGCG